MSGKEAQETSLVKPGSFSNGEENRKDETEDKKNPNNMGNNKEVCAICLRNHGDRETGTPDTCTHIFCFDCINTWSQNHSTCPVDRQPFTSILVRAGVTGPVLNTVAVKVQLLQEFDAEEEGYQEDEEEEDAIKCDECQEVDDPENMYRCNECTCYYHQDCLDPPSHIDAAEDWLCPMCCGKYYHLQPAVFGCELNGLMDVDEDD